MAKLQICQFNYYTNLSRQIYKAIKDKYEKVKGRNSGFALIYFSDFENGLLKKMFRKNFNALKQSNIKKQKHAKDEINKYTFLDFMSDEGEMETDIFLKKKKDKGQVTSI